MKIGLHQQAIIVMKQLYRDIRMVEYTEESQGSEQGIGELRKTFGEMRDRHDESRPEQRGYAHGGKTVDFEALLWYFRMFEYRSTMGDSEYYSIESPSTARLTVKGSRFTARAFPVSSRRDAEQHIGAVAKEFYDATHNCFAYKIGTGAAADVRFNDDGEPSGTAGKPILQAIEGRGLANTLVVVTRYFGGTKLGTGGLIRAYGGVASEALGAARTVKHYLKTKLRIEFDYDCANTVHHYLHRYHGEILASSFGAKTRYDISLKQTEADAFKREMLNATAGRVHVEENGDEE